MKVLFDHQVFSYQMTGGISRYFSELYRGLPGLGWQVEAGFRQTINRYLLNDPNLSPPFVNFLGGWPIKGKAHLLAAWNRRRSRQALRRAGFDLFHPTYYDPYFLNLLGKRPFVLTIHDMIHELFPQDLSDAGPVQERKRLLAHRAAAVIAVSEHTRQDIVRLLGVPASKVTVVYHGNSLHPDLIRPRPVAAPEQYLLFVGARAAYKNATIVWQALRQLVTRWPDLRLVHVGGGPFTATERQTVADWGLSKYIRHFNVDDRALAWLYQQAQCLVCPSRYEGFGLPIVEAMAWGCPVVAAEASCLPEIGGLAAGYANPDQVDDWVGQIDYLLNSPSQAADRDQRLAQANRYSWSACLGKTVSVYQKVCP